jgi:hypothetical protein
MGGMRIYTYELYLTPAHCEDKNCYQNLFDFWDAFKKLLKDELTTQIQIFIQKKLKNR